VLPVKTAGPPMSKSAPIVGMGVGDADVGRADVGEAVGVVGWKVLVGPGVGAVVGVSEVTPLTYRFIISELDNDWSNSLTAVILPINLSPPLRGLYPNPIYRSP